MAEITKTALEKIGKATEMERIMNALTGAGIDKRQVVDNGTLAYMITEGALEGRFITLKVVLAKEYSEETRKGFDITEGISEYELKVQNEAERAAKASAKAAEKAEKKAKADKVKVEA